jgi:hypothetical protein
MSNEEDPPEPPVTQNRDRKFDLQLSQALIDERRLAEIFTSMSIEKIELKSESFQWEQTDNICIEYRCDGRPSGISTTEADVWVHELKRDGKTVVYLMFPIDRLKELCRAAIKNGRSRSGAGDGGRFEVVILPLREILS